MSAETPGRSAEPEQPAAAAAAQAAPTDADPAASLHTELQQTALAVHATASALLRLARGELALSGALVLRALLLTAIALACVMLAVAVGSALLVALGLTAGLGWPGALALCLVVVVASAFVCLARARRHLRGCGLSRTRARLAALVPELTQ